MQAEYLSLRRLSEPLHLQVGAIPDFLGLVWPYLLPPLVVFALEGPLSLRVSARHPDATPLGAGQCMTDACFPFT